MINLKLKHTFAAMSMMLLLGAVMSLVPAAAVAQDSREYQHGIDFVKRPDGQYFLIWASAGNPPVSPAGDWTHDIYYSHINPLDPQISPVRLISFPEAQEPASSTINSAGNIMITAEDGYNTDYEVDQRYGVYSSSLGPIKSYPRTVELGGHSGHVAASGERFIIFSSEGWVNGGGVDNLGSGDDVKAFIYSSTGTFQRKVDISVGSTTRDWWPLIAASPTRAALVWQRYVNGQTYSNLMVSIIDPATGARIKPPTSLQSGVQYYTYSVEYIPAIDRFLIMGAYKSQTNGFAYLLDSSGSITARNESLPYKIVRESQSIVGGTKGVTVVQPVQPSGVMVLSLTPTSISYNTKISDPYPWSYIGTDGIFTSLNSVYIASLSPTGIVRKRFTIP